MMNIQKMMQQAQEVQVKLQQMQEKMKDVDVEGEAGGGLVKVNMSCASIVKAVSIDPSLMDDKETLEDLLVAAVNNAGVARDEKVQAETQRMMQELGLPEDAAGGGGLPF